MIELLAVDGIPAYAQLGGVVIVALGAFKVVEVLVARVVPRKGNGNLRAVEGMCRDICTCQKVTAERLKQMARDQERITEAMQKHQTEVAVGLGKGCPNAEPMQKSLTQLDKAILNLRNR